MFESWALDVRYTLRRLRKRPAYAVLTVLTLSLGVAGTAAVYGIAKRLLVDPLPIRNPEQVAVFWFEGAWSEAEFAYLRPQIDGFTSVAAFRRSDVTLRLGDAPARLVRGGAGTSELFRVLGASPVMGRGFEPGDDRLGAEPVAIVSYSLWRDLGGSRSLVGQRLELAGEPHTVVGVMPKGFWFPDPTVQVWLAQQVDPENGSGNYGLIARMPPGATTRSMGPQLQRITRLLGDRFDFPPEWDLTKNPALTPVREYLLGSVQPALLALLGAMAVILIIACVNVAALMLGQVDGRGTELAVRGALGAGRRRLLQQIVVESVVIGALAGVVGAALAAAGFRFLVAALPLGELAEAATIDWTVFAAAMVVAVIAATAVAVVPGLSIARGELQQRLTRTRTAGIGGRGGGLESGLVVAQAALVLLLACGSLLLIRSVDNKRAIDPGVEVADLAVVDVIMPEASDAPRRTQLIHEMVRSLGAIPGVESVGSTERLPLRGSSDNWGIAFEGRPDITGVTAAFRMITPGYFRTMGIQLVQGRGLLETDRAGVEEGAVVVNRAFADRYFPGQDPVGRRIGYLGSRWDRIVGVVRNVAENDLSVEAVPAVYAPYDQVPFMQTWQTIVLRTAAGRDPAAILDAARRRIQSVAPGIAIREQTTMRNVLSDAIGPALQVMSLLTMLAALALALGIVGIYGVVSHFVTRRRRDWAIRIALGMKPARVAGQIIRRGGALVVAGVVIGLGAFLLLARLLASFLYGIRTADPVSLLASAAILLATGLLAASVPARRASRLDPAVVLREQG